MWNNENNYIKKRGEDQMSVVMSCLKLKEGV